MTVMRHLHLLRHAKSSWREPNLVDRERPLNKRGRRDATRMGKALQTLIQPLPVNVSPARRAQLTLEILCSVWPALAAATHCCDEALYTFSAGDLLAWLRAADDNVPAMFVIGHNPALTDLVNALDHEAALSNLPTAGYAQIALDIASWAELRAGCGEVRKLVFPKGLTPGRAG